MTNPLTQQAEALAGGLPPLLAAAELVAATVAQGSHGRRRAGPGDSFWQFRPLIAGDEGRRIDWRQTAKSSRPFIRESEWEAAQTVTLWADLGPGMAWRSSPSLPLKSERAMLLLLALAALLLRGGERVSLLGHEARPAAGHAGLARLAEAILAARGQAVPLERLKPPARFARPVLAGDFLAPLPALHEALARVAGEGAARGVLLQVLDPAERELPYRGRVRFHAPGGGDEVLIPRVDAIRAEYQNRLAAQIAGVRALAARFGWTALLHDTSKRPESALLAVYQAMEGDRRR